MANNLADALLESDNLMRFGVLILATFESMAALIFVFLFALAARRRFQIS